VSYHPWWRETSFRTKKKLKLAIYMPVESMPDTNPKLMSKPYPDAEKKKKIWIHTAGYKGVLVTVVRYFLITSNNFRR
jgi:hypothetical protein